jgi:hypothetical protein
MLELVIILSSVNPPVLGKVDANLAAAQALSRGLDGAVHSQLFFKLHVAELRTAPLRRVQSHLLDDAHATKEVLDHLLRDVAGQAANPNGSAAVGSLL